LKKREAINLGLHIGIGGALAALVMWHPLMIIFDTFIYATLREQAQHRWDMDESPPRKRGFFDFGWLGWRQVFEIGQWVIGSAVVSIPWYFFG
jgi:hypothetical protein